MNSKNIIISSIIICVGLYLIPNIIYYWKFNDYNLSNEPEKWGVYGDFIGGSINPILTIFNIIALVYLTYTVSHVEDNRANENINAQKIITLNQMRYNVVIELSKSLDTFTNVISEINTGQQDTFMNITVAVNSFRNTSYYFFKELYTKEFDDEYFYPLRSSVEKLTKSFQETKDKVKAIESNVKTLNSYVEELQLKQHTASEEELIELTNKAQKFKEENELVIKFENVISAELYEQAKDYWERKTKFINEINKFIIKEMSPTKL